MSYSYDRTAKKLEPLSKAERERMARDRQDTLDEEEHISSSERREIEAEIKLLRNFSVDVGFNGNDVIRL